MTASDTPSAVLAGLSAEYWEKQLEHSPLLAAYLGDHRYDDRADDYSVEAEHTRREQWVALRDRLAAVAQGTLNESDRVTEELLRGELRDVIRRIDLRLVELASDQMQGAHAELLMLAGQLKAPEPQHAQMAVTRIAELARMLDQAAARYRAGAAAGRSPALINVNRSLRQVDSYLGSPLDVDPFVRLAGPQGWDGEQAWRATLTEAVRDVLRPAFARYRDVYAEELAAVARSDEQPGLAHLAEGEQLYHALIELHTGLALTADELHDSGLEQVTGALRVEFAQVGERAFGTSDVNEIFDRLLNDPSLRYRDGDQILDHARQCLEKAQAAMGDWFGLLPQAPCALSPVPDFLAPDVPAAYYMPPAADGSRPGEYFVNLNEPSERGRYSTASIAYHEAIPGHHLQLAIAAERSDLPAFRRLTWGHSAFVEGWALYTERLADDMGLYDDDLDRLGMLSSDAWRACRLVVDTGLHARGWTRQQAIDFMVEHVPMDRDAIAVEVDRYIGMPGQALSYKVGQREILQLRTWARDQLGPGFDISGFHDAVLGAATISLPVLRRRVSDWVNGAAHP
jgi:uncharacterized protein (DUF885 family)